MNDIVVEINENNNNLIKDFLNNSIPSTFRYFNKRTVDVIKNHIVTLIVIVDNLPVGCAY
jgi:hypothetical protein